MHKLQQTEDVAHDDKHSQWWD